MYTENWRKEPVYVYRELAQRTSVYNDLRGKQFADIILLVCVLCNFKILLRKWCL